METYQMLVFGPRADRYTELLVLDIYKSCIMNPPINPWTWRKFNSRLLHGSLPALRPCSIRICWVPTSIFGVIHGIEILKLDPTTGGGVFISLTH